MLAQFLAYEQVNRYNLNKARIPYSQLENDARSMETSLYNKIELLSQSFVSKSILKFRYVNSVIMYTNLYNHSKISNNVIGSYHNGQYCHSSAK